MLDDFSCKYVKQHKFLLSCSSNESIDSTGSSSSIVFQSCSQEQRDTGSNSEVPQKDTQAVKVLVPSQEKGKMMCPKTMHSIPENFVPCVFLGQQDPMEISRCPAKGWESSALLDEELNNNSYKNKECQWTDKVASKEVRTYSDVTQCVTVSDLFKVSDKIRVEYTYKGY